MKILKSKLLALRIFLALLGVMIVSSGAVASVKWSQPPDKTYNGIDIRCDRNDNVSRTLADDFQCTSTGPISGVHFWGSWADDVKTQITQIHLSIYSDIPATSSSPSMPGALLWSGDFGQGQFTESWFYMLSGQNGYEWWWNPYSGELRPFGDRTIWQYNITIDKAHWFLQQGTATNPVIYWLGVSVTTANTATGAATQFGWKTSYTHWQDAASDLTTAGTWQKLTYPLWTGNMNIKGQPYVVGNPIDMAFEIAAPPSPYVVLDGHTGWQTALTGGTILPVDPCDWDQYMKQWKDFRESPTSPNYPPNAYMQPDLSVYQGNPCSGSDFDPNSPGLVMAWGDQAMPSGSYSAAWKYKYPVDPDLTNSIITVTVQPPCTPVITTVSLGLKDIGGNIRAWFWNVPGTLPCGVPTPASIDTSVLGVAAATPTADGYMNNPLFDITQVVEIMFDENAAWVAGTTVPPPGSSIPRAWNYWHDLTVTPKPTTTSNPLKWSQPPVQIDPGRILGWDEKSIDNSPPLLADDWICKDQRPVTDIHWWGSFIGWNAPDLPTTQLPTKFHFGIWTDVQPTATSNIPFSHPGEMIWEYVCTNYQWKFVGYDKDPRQTAGVPPTVQDSCFRFDCDLPTGSWFYQKPDPNGHGTIYWLSIAAEYPAGTNPQYPWGWKTRPHFFQDDAVRILTTDTGNWPPVLHSKWNSGQHVEYPRGVSWDLAFELTTSTNTVPPPVDINGDGIVNFVDLAIFANYWLKTVP